MIIKQTTELIYERENDNDMKKYEDVRETLILLGYKEYESDFYISFTLESEIRCEAK